MSKDKKKRRKNQRLLSALLAVFIAGVVLLIVCIGIFKLSTYLIKGRECPESLLRLVRNQPEAEDFVYGYSDREDLTGAIDLSDEADSQEVPLFIQWDKRWGYDMYGEDFLAVTGCGPTCLSMVYCYLTDDWTMHPGEMARWAEKNGYYVENVGTSWDLMSTGAETLGLDCTVSPLTENNIISALSSGQVIICSVGPGDFTTEGHFIVFAGINDDGTLKINDPNSIKRSERSWNLETVIPQIRQFWIYS